MAGNWNSVVKNFKIFENLLGEFGLELGHLGFIIRNYWLWRWVSGAWRRSMRFCFAFGTAPVGYAPHVRFAVLLCIWDCARGVCSPCAVCGFALHLGLFLFLSYTICHTPVVLLGVPPPLLRDLPHTCGLAWQEIRGRKELCFRADLEENYFILFVLNFQF